MMNFGMENKYYTPTLEEFYVGFEFEYITIKYRDDRKPLWEKSSNFLETHKMIDEEDSLDTIKGFLLDNEIRVKYLSKEDVESLGFKFDLKITERTTRYKSDKYMLLHNNSELTNHNNNRVRIAPLPVPSNEIFNGKIKNKSELVKLLKQLEI